MTKRGLLSIGFWLGLSFASVPIAWGGVDQWDFHEVTLSTSTIHINPFDVKLSAWLAGPNGESRNVLGFFAGDGSFKLRFLATQKGTYRWTSTSNDPDLDGRSGVFEVVSSSLAPLVVVDSTYPVHFRYVNGNYILLRAYYALNLLGADDTHPVVGGWRDLIDHLALYGYNALFFNLLAVGQTTKHRDKMPPWDLVEELPPSHAFQSGCVTDFHFVPWPKVGTIDQQPEPGGSVDFTRFHLLFWDQLDRVLLYLRSKSMIAHIMFYPDDNSYVSSLEPASNDEQRFFRYLIARLSAYSNVIWNDGIDLWEYRPRNSWAPWTLWWLEFFDEVDPWQHPRSSRHFSGAKKLQKSLDTHLLTFASSQIDGMYDEWVYWMRQNKKPITADDGWYETPASGGTLAWGDGDDFRDMLWESLTAGGVGILHRDDWGMCMWLSRVGEGLSGHRYNKIQMEFVNEHVSWWSMRSHNELVSTYRCCLADPETGEYVVYFDQELPQSIEVDLSKSPGILAVTWLNTVTGSKISGENVSGGEARLFTAPSRDDWILHIRHPVTSH